MSHRKTVLLGLDSSVSPLLVAACKDDKTATCRRSGIKQERLLFPAVHRVLDKVEGTLQDVSRVFIVRGPGRFTGIRIALTFASMLKYLNQAEVYGATVFEILNYQVKNSRAFQTWNAAHAQGALGIVLHAFRQEYFLQIFDAENSAPLWLSYEELTKRLAGYKAPLFLAGTGAGKAPLDSFLKGPYTFAPHKDCVVQPKTLLTLCAQGTWQEQALEPLYLKPARFEQEQPK